jgi:hypothetical protein
MAAKSNRLTDMKKLILLLSFVSLPGFAVEQAEPPVSPAEGSNQASQRTYHSSTVREIVKMHQAGVENSVVRSYIQSTTVPYKATPDDIIYLHEQKVTDDLVTEWIKRGAELSGTATQPAQTAPQPAQIESNVLPLPQAQQPAANPPVVYQQPQVVQAAPTVVQTTPTYVYSEPPVVYANVDPWWYAPPVYFGFGLHHAFYGPRFGYGPRFYGHVGGPVFHGSIGFGHGGFGHGGGGFHHR